ncbi:hypothetical protein [Mangrovicoccus sp. HB161399]|uniref:hypothetical protein n=1 Tax=Mangrovicoccus sp. HB161399 TaxID=2720392 RepID=UPI001556621F|nr:hypothetical protein [Mangrovicoccus sp. HB161399]
MLKPDQDFAGASGTLCKADRPYLVIIEPDAGIAEVLVAFGESHGWSCWVYSDDAALTEALCDGPEPILLLIDADLIHMHCDGALAAIAALDRPMRLRFATGVNGAHVVAASLMARARDLSVGPSLMKPFSPEAINLMLDREREELGRI